MFDENMHLLDDDETHPLGLYVGNSECLPMVFQFWAAELARDMLRLGIYFRAVGIMLQIPGAAEYEWARDEQKPDTCELVAAGDDNTLHNVLAECLRRLDAEHLTEQLPMPNFRPEKLPAEWKELLDRREEVENGLLSVAAECLDRLIVEPGLREIEKDGEPHWWQRFRVETR